MGNQKTIRIGDKLLAVDRIENGVPVVKVDAREIKHADGHQDVIVFVPCLTLSAKGLTQRKES